MQQNQTLLMHLETALIANLADTTKRLHAYSGEESQDKQSHLRQLSRQAGGVSRMPFVHDALTTTDVSLQFIR